MVNFGGILRALHTPKSSLEERGTKSYKFLTAEGSIGRGGRILVRYLDSCYGKATRLAKNPLIPEV